MPLYLAEIFCYSGMVLVSLSPGRICIAHALFSSSLSDLSLKILMQLLFFVTHICSLFEIDIQIERRQEFILTDDAETAVPSATRAGTPAKVTGCWPVTPVH